MFVPLYLIDMVGLPPFHVGNLVIYSGCDNYLQFLWDGLEFHDVELDLRPILIFLLAMALPFIYAKLHRPSAGPERGMIPAEK